MMIPFSFYLLVLLYAQSNKKNVLMLNKDMELGRKIKGRDSTHWELQTETFELKRIIKSEATMGKRGRGRA